jgi:hypothetical protein
MPLRLWVGEPHVVEYEVKYFTLGDYVLDVVFFEGFPIFRV